MAQKQVTIFIDDMTGEETAEGATHTFVLNGVEYEIDLSPDSYDQMLEAFSPYLKAGRKVGRGKRGAKAVRTRLDGPSTAEIREWAKTNGYEVNERGRVPSEVRAAYEAAH
ncbi:histone-like nucleoid-structuring protein Lsr2 [Streptomyces wuyuanensis]|uniref:histone-like nucleoid-structuring protein Lsr2 n=1 Tax=Streptomyces wuyuanensis TaxID=1196353 RepID=UPI003424C9A1